MSKFKSNNHCGFIFPASVKSYKHQKTLNSKNISTLQFELTEDHKIHIQDSKSNNTISKQIADCPSKKNCDDNSNLWTMIYDEGIDIKYKGLRLLAFFQFAIVPKNDKRKQQTDIHGQMQDKITKIVNKVNCGKTYVGLAKKSSNPRKTACFILEKKKQIVKFVSNEVTLMKKTHTNISNKKSQDLSFDILQIQYKNKPTIIGERSRFLSQGFSGDKVAEYSQSQDIKKNLGQTAWEKYMSESKDHDSDCKDKGLPCSIDWTSFQPQTQNQGYHADCYIYSTRHMLMARMKILHGIDTDVSISHLLNCGYYHQGNNGGFSYEVLASQNYSKSMSGNCWKQAKGNCSYKCEDPQVSVSHYGYVGDWYGNCSERAMMEELQWGPIVMNFEDTPWNFQMLGMFYDVDVYEPPKGWQANYLKKDKRGGYEKVNHSNLIYGYGVTDGGKKFWRVQNSWGKNFGDNGVYKVIRGIDAMGIESNAEVGYPYLAN